MKQLTLVLVTLALASTVASCTLIDSPENAAREWLQAFGNLDGNKIAERTCAAQQANVQQAGLWTSAITLIGQYLVGQGLQGKTDVSSLNFTTVRSSSDVAYVRVTGQIRAAVLAFATTQNVDETWKMVREDGKWKWCGQ